MLTATAIRQAKPKEKPFKLSDGGGLHLLVRPAGGKYWRYSYRFEGKQKTLALGTYPDISLSKAREKHQSARALLADGVDPGEVKKAEKQQDRAEKNHSFQSIALEWWEKEKGRWSTDHGKRVLAGLKSDVFPYIGDTNIEAITAQDCLAVVRRVEERGALDVASRIKQKMSSVFRYAIYTGKAAINPVDVLKDVIQTRKVSHRKMLDPKELPAFLEAVDTSPKLFPTTRLALKLLVLTFVRSGELRGAKWDEFDLDAREWRIPAERMKMKEEHIVPLSDQSISILGELKAITGEYALAFPGSHDYRRPMSENTLTYAIRKRLGFDATAHGFRALASTILNEQGWNADVIERQLAHAERNKVRAAYHRSQYLDERHRMMQSWADYLGGLKVGGEVVAIKRTAS